MEDIKSIILCIILLCLTTAVALLSREICNIRQQNENYESIIQGIHEKHDLEYQDDTLIDISDWNHLKYYHVISIDNGTTWYLISDKRKIIGDFDKLHPKLRDKINKQHEDLKKLADYVDKNGPIGSKGTITNTELEMLKDVGAVAGAIY